MRMGRHLLPHFVPLSETIDNNCRRRNVVVSQNPRNRLCESDLGRADWLGVY
jgi:hypothetical protein